MVVDTPIEDLLAWPDDERARVDTLLAIRRWWMTDLYREVRAEWSQRADDRPPRTMAEAAPIVEQLPSFPIFVWIDKYLQDRLWAEVGRMVDGRLSDIEATLAPRPGDLGTIMTDPDLEYPAYYTPIDFHRQPGGIWPDNRGAVVYAIGARVIHVGRNDEFELHDKFVADLPLDDEPGTVLDLACGFGKTTFSLKRRWPAASVTGIDLSVPCLALARRLATARGLDVHWRQGDVEHLPVPDGSIDLVTVTMALHELPIDAIVRALTEARRVLRPGGTLAALENRLIGDPLRDVLGAWHSDVISEPYMNPFRAEDFGGLARRAGFDAVDVADWCPPGAVPGSEHDPTRWSSPWSLLVATRSRG
jgi:ubiquinone/menaquinone biosynthesis C-methylase UbiE